MEQRMMNGIKAHAEGWTEPPYQETVEIVLWFVALIVGAAAAVLFVARPAWVSSLTLAMASVFVVLFFTFSQPMIAVRVLLDVALVVGLVMALRTSATVAQPSVAPQPARSNA
jgi:ABC-type multidrug transport system fused ATPase/permease subunit